MEITLDDHQNRSLSLSTAQRKVISALISLLETNKVDGWLVGGTVRDFFINKKSKDIDIVVSGSAHELCRYLQRKLSAGALVILGGDDHEESCRFVYEDVQLDVSSFRGIDQSLDVDLVLRDFTINSMALPLSFLQGETVSLVDPLDGYNDLMQGVLRHCPAAFEADALRILRGYRFAAELGFTILDETKEDMLASLELLGDISPERIQHELDCIIISDGGAQVFAEMGRDNILSKFLPELDMTIGVEQSGAHHLNVFEHCLSAYKHMFNLLYGQHSFALQNINDQSLRVQLLWAALLHDIGKPSKKVVLPEKITFHRHDEDGAEMISVLARRMKWSNELRKNVSVLVAMHMHPFHLCTVQDKEGLSKKAALRLYRRAGDLLTPLFYLALADSLASQGVDKPKGMEEQLLKLYGFVEKVFEENIKPSLGAKLLTGADILNDFKVKEGPLIGQLLSKIEEKQVVGELTTSSEARLWLKEYLISSCREA